MQELKITAFDFDKTLYLQKQKLNYDIEFFIDLFVIVKLLAKEGAMEEACKNCGVSVKILQPLINAFVGGDDNGTIFQNFFNNKNEELIRAIRAIGNDFERDDGNHRIATLLDYNIRQRDIAEAYVAISEFANLFYEGITLNQVIFQKFINTTKAGQIPVIWTDNSAENVAAGLRILLPGTEINLRRKNGVPIISFDYREIHFELPVVDMFKNGTHISTKKQDCAVDHFVNCLKMIYDTQNFEITNMFDDNKNIVENLEKLGISSTHINPETGAIIVEQYDNRQFSEITSTPPVSVEVREVRQEVRGDIRQQKSAEQQNTEQEKRLVGGKSFAEGYLKGKSFVENYLAEQSSKQANSPSLPQ